MHKLKLLRSPSEILRFFHENKDVYDEVAYLQTFRKMARQRNLEYSKALENFLLDGLRFEWSGAHAVDLIHVWSLMGRNIPMKEMEDEVNWVA